MITSFLIESVWKEKTRPDKIQETIQSAFYEIYRGGFDEIKELDEEQMCNSYLNSGLNTDRLLSDTNWSSCNNNISEKKQTPKSLNLLAEADQEGHKTWTSGIYDRDAVNRTTDVGGPYRDTKRQLDSKRLTENIVDNDIEDQYEENCDARTIEICEPEDCEDDKYDDDRDDDYEPRARVSRRRSLTRSSHNFKVCENSNNLNISDNKNANKSPVSRVSHYKGPLNLNFITVEANNPTKPKQITMNSAFRQKRLKVLKNKCNNSTYELNRNSFVTSKQSSFVQSTSYFKKEGMYKTLKDEGSENSTPLLPRNSNFDKSNTVVSKPHSRNSSTNSLRERLLFGEAGSFKYECQNAKQPRIRVENRKTIFQKKDALYKYRP